MAIWGDGPDRDTGPRHPNLSSVLPPGCSQKPRPSFSRHAPRCESNSDHSDDRGRQRVRQTPDLGRRRLDGGEDGEDGEDGDVLTVSELRCMPVKRVHPRQQLLLVLA